MQLNIEKDILVMFYKACDQCVIFKLYKTATVQDEKIINRVVSTQFQQKF